MRRSECLGLRKRKGKKILNDKIRTDGVKEDKKESKEEGESNCS